MSRDEHPDDLASSFGANEWLIDEMYDKYQADPQSVEPAWREFFAKRDGTSAPADEKSGKPSRAPEPEPAPKAAEGGSDQDSVSHIDPRTLINEAADFHDRGLPPVKAQPATSVYANFVDADEAGEEDKAEDQVERLRGPAARVVTNMETSLELPTATSVRSVPAKLLIENRLLINSHLARTRGGKVSFTHLIGFALVEALGEVPDLNAAYDEVDGKPAVKHPAHVNMGLAIDMPKPDGTRQLLVPSIKAADEMDFAQFWAAYDDIVRKARNSKLTVDDFMGTTITLTNPGTIGTQFSVARLMKGQGAIIGVGAMDYPAEYQGASAKTIARMGVSKILALSSTYDHRIIQGAASGELLKVMATKLTGQDGFYDRVFTALRMPYAPVRWQRDVEFDTKRELSKSARIAEMIHAFRSRGHLQADTDPLASRQRRFHDLDFTNHGLTLWDLDRTFPTGGFAGTDALTLREILQQLRDAYCRNVGIEYMHLQDPAQRAWFQERLERPFQKASNEEQLQILYKLNEAEAFETFLQTKFVGQKRFSLEGGESLIPMLDTVLTSAAREGLDDVAIGMAHRGRLNVLANIAGKSYGQIFDEFEGNMDPRTVEGSGDVKYHLGTEGTFTSPTGEHTNVYLAANPSHLETVNGVLEGIVRAKQDRIDLGTKGYSVLPILIHGDAAFAGQGVVQETLNLSQLRGYRTGGTMHIIVNNQIGFTTGPASSRSSQYCTDIVKGLQIPVFHVNGDDPEAVARVAKIAYDFRQEFNKDVVIDLICYRRRGHNEGDDPSMTQPVMYSLIENKASVRQLYQEALIGRGDISSEQAESALADFKAKLEEAFASTKDDSGHRTLDSGEGGDVVSPDSDSVAGLELPSSQQEDAGVMVGWSTAIPQAMVERIGQAHLRPPEGFTVHPKLKKLLERRDKMTKDGGIDWGMGELLAFGSLLIEGVPVRLTGQDSRRGTFTQRHATFHDYVTGAEWTPLQYLTEDQGKFWVYDSPLSEYVVMAYEYGYSVERPDALVLWEAQFGDFVNGAQIVVDEFVSSSEQKWGQRSSVVLLLPHGYEGQGPDHSSGRIERFLQLCAEDNMIVVQPSTPANHFHMLRRQAYNRPRKPLIVFSPKQLLRLKAAASAVEDFTTGSFQPVIGEVGEVNNVDRVLMCSGRVYYDLAAQRDKRGDSSTAIIRLEQLYPLPVEELKAELAKYEGAELVWVQDEPENQGPWYHIAMQLAPQLDRPVRVISRPAAASPSAGTMKLHQSQAEKLFAAAFDRS
ncbi:multifunctional oxoglutarate decarboxylase/oxoglutarate dehydrogenase thiamine pyrophosphate-binding subunit/dihydrolipoyllysine-residue succinyltransferase subunit [Bowdeniella massiliensis]|uniref:multifunctional oxoglutarate decarboxylase/oxoglutarate dehydrogenase thiamine pyrophosphate-binding subunit/dihydrolipoyllysine-residue succinyltransferase subunit n=1 Tax=Bowdeniella massiliensis TaxID=2932264 RepID=UPI0032B2CE7C